MTKYLMVFFFLFSAFKSKAQQYIPDSSLPKVSSAYAKQFYFTKRGEESAIYTGIRHESYSASIEGIAYFQSPDWQNGTVLYDQIFYENIWMKYDLYKDQLIVIPGNQSGMPIALFSPRVSEFSFSGSNFIRIEKADEKTSPAKGFYQQLTSGRITVLSKRFKLLTERIENRTVIQKFEERAKYFLLKDGIYYPVRNKKELMAVVKDKKKEIQQFLSNNKMKYRRQREKVIVAVAEFYNQQSR